MLIIQKRKLDFSITKPCRYKLEVAGFYSRASIILYLIALPSYFKHHSNIMQASPKSLLNNTSGSKYLKKCICIKPKLCSKFASHIRFHEFLNPLWKCYLRYTYISTCNWLLLILSAYLYFCAVMHVCTYVNNSYVFV